jgi:hypothetical protein
MHIRHTVFIPQNRPDLGRLKSQNMLELQIDKILINLYLFSMSAWSYIYECERAIFHAA